MAYSIEVRAKALEDFVKGHSDEQVSAKHGVSTYTLNNWKKLLLSTGSLEKKKVKRKSGKPYKHTPEKIGSLLDKSKVDKNKPSTDSKSTKTSSASRSKDILLIAKSKKKKKNKKKKKKEKQ